MNRFYLLGLITLASLLYTSCSKSQAIDPEPNTPLIDSFTFIKGADVSWVTEMEDSGRVFYNSSGIKQDPFVLMQSLGFNTIRLRAWVHPNNKYNSTADVIAKAKRVKQLGMKLLIDFHYSNEWADPGKQNKPAQWVGAGFNALKDSLYNYTAFTLNQIKAAGIRPEWIQIGNETDDGMLWPEGKASVNMYNFAQLIIAGYQSAKSVFPEAGIIVHVSNGWNNSLFRWLFDGLKSNGANWDIIGMSLYPDVNNWSVTTNQCLQNITDIISKYQKPVMIVETGMPWDKPAECKNYLNDLIIKLKKIENNKCLGLMYWEPQSFGNWKGYTLGAFNNSGKPTIALDAFQ